MVNNIKNSTGLSVQLLSFRKVRRKSHNSQQIFIKIMYFMNTSQLKQLLLSVASQLSCASCSINFSISGEAEDFNEGSISND